MVRDDRMLPTKLAFVDTETTGLSVTRDRIIEIGIVRVENGKVVSKYQTLLNPGFIFPDVITSITGITPVSLENAPTFRQVKDDILEMLKDCIFVAHNVRFDYAFLKNEFKREELTFTTKHFCTARLSRSLFPKERHHNLDSIIERFDIQCKNRHRAFDDAYVLWEFYKKIQKSVSEELLDTFIQKALKRASSPMHLPEGTIENLPELPGVYVFYGDNGTPLYVGKSVNIKERVMSHFSQDYTAAKEMHITQQIKSIETHVTSGELGALLKEAAMVKKLQPLYNRKLRISRKMVLMKKRIDNIGYTHIYLEDAGEIDPQALEDIVGVFRSKRQAKEFLIQKCKEHMLCEKLLGLESGKSACFGYRLDTCKGACIQEEHVLKYNIRVIEAFSTNSIKKWPFSSAIAIAEKDTLEKTAEYFVIDKWCLLGSFTEQDGNSLTGKDFTYTFDLDTYKILLSFLAKKDNWKFVHELRLGDAVAGRSSEKQKHTHFPTLS